MKGSAMKTETVIEPVERKAPAYVPYKTLKNWIRSLTQGVPPRLEKRMFSSMSGSTQSQLIQALRALGLMDANWAPTEKLRKLQATVNSEVEYRDALRAVLEAAYPFLKTFQLNVATLGMLQEEMEQMGASGGTVSKCIAFLVPAAKDAGMEVSPYIEKPGPRSPTNGRQRRSRGSRQDLTTAPVQTQAAPVEGTISAAHKMLLDKYPSFDPAWSSEVQAKWFDGFAKLQEALEGKAK
jgi:hypothetical protein